MTPGAGHDRARVYRWRRGKPRDPAHDEPAHGEPACDAPAYDEVDRAVTETRPTVPPPPPERPAPAEPAVPWTFFDVVAVGGIVYLLVAPLAATLVRGLAPREQATAVAFPVVMISSALAVLGWVALRYRDRLRLLFGRARAGVRDVAAGIGHGLAAFLGLNLLLGLLFTWLTDLLGIEVAPVQQRIRELAAEPDLLPFLLVSVAIAAPLAEELFFRGLLFQLLRARAGPWAGIVLSGLLFGLVHWEAGNAVGTAYMVSSLSVVGAYLAWVFHRRGSLVAPITMHATFNLLAAGWILQGLG